MTRNEYPGIMNLVQALSNKISDMQREIVGLRQDVKTLTFLIREQQGNQKTSPDEQINNEDE